MFLFQRLITSFDVFAIYVFCLLGPLSIFNGTWPELTIHNAIGFIPRAGGRCSNQENSFRKMFHLSADQPSMLAKTVSIAKH